MTTRHKERYSHPPRQTNGVAEIDAELIRRANRIGCGYQPKEIEEEQEEPEELREEGEIEQAAETEEDSVIMRGDNLQSWTYRNTTPTEKRRNTFT